MLEHIIPVLSEEHQQLIDSIVHQIETNTVTYILPAQGLSAVQIAETASRTIELAKSGQTYIAKPHLIESFDDFDAKLVDPLKKKLSTSSIVIIETITITSKPYLKHSSLQMNLQVRVQKLSSLVQKTN